MVIYNSFKNRNLSELVRIGGIGVIPTDTLYGIVCSAFDEEAVEKVFEIKGRDDNKPPIILLSDVQDLSKFCVRLTDYQRSYVERYWPGKVSFIFGVDDTAFRYLSRGSKSLTFRVPGDGKLRSFLQKTGPLIAPSANPQGLEPAVDVDMAIDYFIGKIDFLVEGESIRGSASTLVDLTGDEPKVIRQGDVNIRDF